MEFSLRQTMLSQAAPSVLFPSKISLKGEYILVFFKKCNISDVFLLSMLRRGDL